MPWHHSLERSTFSVSSCRSFTRASLSLAFSSWVINSETFLPSLLYWENIKIRKNNRTFTISFEIVCTPLGFARLFTVLSQLLVGPQFLRNLDEEVLIIRLEVESLQNKLKTRMECSEIATEELVNGNAYVGLNGDGFLKKVQQMKFLVPKEESNKRNDEGVVRKDITKLSKELITLGK